MAYQEHLISGNKIRSYTTRHAVQMIEEEFYTMRFVFSGKEECITKNRQLNIYPDSFAFFNKNTPYVSNIDSERPIEALVLLYSSNFLSEFHHSYTTPLHLALDEPFSKSEMPLFNESIFPLDGDLRNNILALKLSLSAGHENELLINEHLHHCLRSYYDIYHKEIIARYENLDFIKKKTKLEIMKRLVLAKEFISNNYNRDITLSEIATASCLSSNHLLRRFKEAYGISPFYYLMRLRLTRAKQLLIETPYSVKEIVGMVGFECPSSFSRLFKKNFDIQPQDFRNRTIMA